MDGMMTTPLNSEETDKTQVQLEENKQTKLNRMKRDLKVDIFFPFLYFVCHARAWLQTFWANK